ncbi:MAG: type II toxin-antitoxin system RelE/ParE family toxin [Saprospiraceae bacterium]
MKIRLSGRASEQLALLLEYLELEWSPQVRDNFILKLERSFIAIETLPNGFPVSEKFTSLRKCVVTPQTSAYYSRGWLYSNCRFL